MTADEYARVALVASVFVALLLALIVGGRGALAELDCRLDGGTIVTAADVTVCEARP